MQSQPETLQIGLMNKFNQNLAMFFWCRDQDEGYHCFD